VAFLWRANMISRIVAVVARDSEVVVDDVVYI
jgi:hypothetical protein